MHESLFPKVTDYNRVCLRVYKQIQARPYVNQVVPCPLISSNNSQVLEFQAPKASCTCSPLTIITDPDYFRIHFLNPPALTSST